MSKDIKKLRTKDIRNLAQRRLIREDSIHRFGMLLYILFWVSVV
jgi:hypothetical protein